MKGLRFVSYARCSSDDQAEGDFTTIDVQVALNRERIEAMNGELVAEIADKGRTGTNLERPGWRQVLALAESRAIDAVIVSYMSRLGRGDAYTVAEYLLKQKKVRVEMVQEKFTPDLAGRMQKRTKIFLDGMYADQVSEWTKTKQEAMVKEGYFMGGNRPFGLIPEFVPGMQPSIGRGGHPKAPPKRLVPHPEEAPIVRAAFALYLATSNAGDVQRMLRKENRTYTWQGIEKPYTWPMTTVTRLLKDEVYKGVLRFGQYVNEQAHEALVDPSEFAIVQKRLKDKAARPAADAARPNGWVQKPTKGTEAELPYYLRGRVYCGHCGCLMTPASATGATKPIAYYQCIRGTSGGKACPIMRVNASNLHWAVLQQIIACAQHPSRIERALTDARGLMEAEKPNFSEEKSLRGSINTARREAQRILAAIKQAGNSRTLLAELARLEEREETLVAKLAEVQKQRSALVMPRPEINELAALWQRLAENWLEATLEERTTLLSLIVTKVEFQAKREGTLSLKLHRAGFSQSVPGKFVETTKLSAGVRLELTTFGL